MDEELIQISEEIFAYIRSQLTFHLRFMDLALNNYQLIPDALEYRCDGKFFHYPPIALIKTFRNNPNEMVRGYLHVVLHSVFQHLYFSKNRRMSLWNLAADIAVENVIEQLGLSCAETPASQEKQRQIAKIREKVPEFTAQKIYHYLEDELHMTITTSRRRVTAEKASQKDEELLDLGSYDFVLVVSGQVFNSKGVMFEFTQSRHRPDQVCFVESAVRQRVKKKGRDNDVRSITWRYDRRSL